MPQVKPSRALYRQPRIPLAALFVLSFAASGCAVLERESPGADRAAERDELEETVGEVAANGVVEVTPLADPAVPPLLDRARAAERAGEVVRARTFLEQALSLAPSDPMVWQRLAELYLLNGEWPSAAEAARRSFDLGPKVGTLCARNWVTMARAFQAQGLVDRAGHAEREAEDCPVRARERL